MAKIVLEGGQGRFMRGGGGQPMIDYAWLQRGLKLG